MENKYKIQLNEILKSNAENVHSVTDFVNIFDGDGSPPAKKLYDGFKKAVIAITESNYDDPEECVEEADNLIAELKKSRKTPKFWELYFQYVEIEFGANTALPPEEPTPAPEPQESTSESSEPPHEEKAEEENFENMDFSTPEPEEIPEEDWELSLETASQFFIFHKADSLKQVNNIKIQTRSNRPLFINQDITLYNGIAIDVMNKFTVTKRLAIITDFEMSRVLVAGELTEQKNDTGINYFFTAKKENIFYEGFEKRGKFMLILVDGSFRGISAPCPMYAQQINLRMKELPTTEQILCIDFGTSNTSAGTYGIFQNTSQRIPELVHFINSADNTFSKICPTVVYVDDCKDEDNVKYLFGFDAQKKIREMDYVTEATSVFELKKWVSDSLNDEIEVCDENGFLATVRKSAIVKQYLEYIITQAEFYFGVRFKRLHFTSPVKLKDKFVSFMRKQFKGEYEITASDKCVDEAVAVIFEYITKEDFSNPLNEDIFDKKIVVLDCGGGTTDLAMCEYHSELDGRGYRKVLVHTRSENGNNRFGGNNITYKIMQLIKIKICEIFAEGELAEQISLLNVFQNESDILKQIDNQLQTVSREKNSILDDIYRDFQNLYELCEQVIPTKFENVIADNDKVNVKRNFYFLWQFAEQIKMAFYREDKVIVDKRTYLDLDSLSKSSYLYKYDQQGELVRIDNPMDDIEISITQIQKLICGDIYMLLSELLPEDADAMDYYFLSGQSCKIKLFNDLLKEFVAGKKLRTKIYEGDQKSRDLDLKLKCIRGSISYIATNASGNEGMIEIRTDRPNQIYAVLYPSQEMELTESAYYRLNPLTPIQTELDLSVRNLNDNSIQRVNPIKIPPIDMTTDYTCAEILNRNGGIYFAEEIQKTELEERLSKDLTNGTRYSLVLPSRDGYGYYILFLQYQDSNFYISDEIHMSFEEGMYSFFDGSK